MFIKSYETFKNICCSWNLTGSHHRWPRNQCFLPQKKILYIIFFYSCQKLAMFKRLEITTEDKQVSDTVRAIKRIFMNKVDLLKVKTTDFWAI